VDVKFLLPMVYPAYFPGLIVDRPFLMMRGLLLDIQEEDPDNLYDFGQPERERYWLTLSSWASSEQYPTPWRT